MSGVLVVGYGSPIRGDDAVGWRVADLARTDPRMAGVTVLARHQLTPELAEDIARAEIVVLVDASTAPPGVVEVTEITGPARPSATGAWSHHVDPGHLVDLASRLFGRATPTYVLSIGAGCFESGTELSPAVEAALPEAVAEVARLAARRR